jgi:hypothetical protein
MIAAERDLLGAPAIRRSADFIHGDRVIGGRGLAPSSLDTTRRAPMPTLTI